jgi:hypothetical protein
VVPTDHPSSLPDGGRHFVRNEVKVPQNPTPGFSIQQKTKGKILKRNVMEMKGYLGLRRRGGKQLGVDLNAILFPFAPHLRRRPPYHGGHAAPARGLQKDKQNDTRLKESEFPTSIREEGKRERGGNGRGVTSVSPRRRPMISSVSVVRAWERQVSHTSSLILTEVSDISVAGSGRRRWAGVSVRPVAWWVRPCGSLHLCSVCSKISFWGRGPASRRPSWRGLCCACLAADLGPRHAVRRRVTDPVRCGAAWSARPSRRPGDCCGPVLQLFEVGPSCSSPFKTPCGLTMQTWAASICTGPFKTLCGSLPPELFFRANSGFSAFSLSR